jgi:hypothetical protein
VLSGGAYQWMPRSVPGAMTCQAGPVNARERSTAAVIGLATLGFVALVLALLQVDRDDVGDRRDEVASAGAMVMPFDLERTTHVFETTDTGGVQRIVSDDRDEDQIELIREHLGMEAERFRAGDFSDPAVIHGDDMPGLAVLRSAGSALQVQYRVLPDGAQVTYTGADGEVVAAIHAWFDAQLRDHGAHAEPG